MRLSKSFPFCRTTEIRFAKRTEPSMQITLTNDSPDHLPMIFDSRSPRFERARRGSGTLMATNRDLHQPAEVLRHRFRFAIRLLDITHQGFTEFCREPVRISEQRQRIRSAIDTDPDIGQDLMKDHRCPVALAAYDRRLCPDRVSRGSTEVSLRIARTLPKFGN